MNYITIISRFESAYFFALKLCGIDEYYRAIFVNTRRYSFVVFITIVATEL